MVYVTHRATGVRRIPAAWLDGFAPSGFRLATAGEVAAWHGARGLDPPPPEGPHCPVCARRVPAGAAERRLHREACASGALEVWLHHCPACGAALAAEVAEAADIDASDSDG